MLITVKIINAVSSTCSFLPPNFFSQFFQLSHAGSARLDISGKTFCPNIFQVEVLYWGNNPVASASVEVSRAELGRIGAQPGYRLLFTRQTNSDGLVNLTLQRPQVGVYEYKIKATARGFLPSEEIVVAYEAGRTDCIQRRQMASFIAPTRPAASDIIDAVDDLLPLDLPRGPRADIVMLIVLLFIIAVIAIGGYRLYGEFSAARAPPQEPPEEPYVGEHPPEYSLTKPPWKH